jgi:hypothetical protein
VQAGSSTISSSNTVTWQHSEEHLGQLAVACLEAPPVNGIAVLLKASTEQVGLCRIAYMCWMHMDAAASTTRTAIASQQWQQFRTHAQEQRENLFGG